MNDKSNGASSENPSYDEDMRAEYDFCQKEPLSARHTKITVKTTG